METQLKRSCHGILAAWFAGCSLCGGAIEVAGSLLVELDAVDFKRGSEKWPQHSRGTEITGDFIAKGSPSRQTIAGAEAVVFDGDGDYFVGPITTAALHAAGAKHSVEIWVFQGNVRDQESVVSWGKRQGPDQTFAGFRYGADPDFGAIARWAVSESGFSSVPPPGQWHHLAYTYDGKTQSVYVDGKLDNQRSVGLLDAHDMLPIHLGAEICGDLKLEGQFSHYSGALAKVRVHSGALGPDEVRRNYEAEVAGFPGPSAKPLLQSPMHRFSFNNPAGPVEAGTAVVDSIGGISAIIRGANAKFTGSCVELPGGNSATEAYVDLPNGLISARESLSIEFWETQIAAQDWCRILSIGTNMAGEITGPGGSFVGSETLTLFGNVGATQVNRFARSYGSYPNGGPDRNPMDYPDADYGVEFHQVITYDKELQEWHWYRNGVLMEVIPDRNGPTTMKDVNVWLGRSEFSSDNNFRGLFNEFRIYNHALSEGEIYGNFLAGPDKLNLGSAGAAFNWMPVVPGSHSYANSGISDHWNTGVSGPHPNGAGTTATFASPLEGDQDIRLDERVTLGSLNLGTRSRGGAFKLRAEKSGAITMDSGSSANASITQLPGSPGNFIHAPITLRSDTEITNQSVHPLVLGGAIRGEGAFIKGGSGPVILTGEDGDFSGSAKIVSGALIFGDSGITGMLSATRFTVLDPGLLVFNRRDDIELGRSIGGSGRIIHQGRGRLFVPESTVLTTSGSLELSDGSGDFLHSGRIDGLHAISSDSRVVFRGQSRTRVVDNISIGSKNGGILTIQDSAAVEMPGRGHLNIGDLGGGQSLMILKGGSVTCKELAVGKNAGTSAVLLQSGGDLRKEKQDALLDSRIGGSLPDSHQVWGSWRMTGGTYTDDWNLQVGGYGTGVMEVDGGVVKVAGFLGIGRYEDDAKNASHGLLDVKAGSVATTGSETLLLVGEEGFGVLNIRGTGSVTCANKMIIGAGSIKKPGEGTVNLLPGGVLTTGGITQFNQTEAIGRLNFDGGTLRASTSTDSFIEGIDYAYVRKGGARIDSNGFDVKIIQPLVAPRGSGILTIPLFNGGSGYVGPPVIDIAGGGGNGATAVADLVDGSIKSITITHAGDDYLSAPAVNVLGGGSGNGLILGAPVRAANGSGGLVKTGAGILTLGANNSYTGVTSVDQGGVRLEGRLTGGVTVAAGASFGGNGSIASSLEAASGSTISADAGRALVIKGNATIRGRLDIQTEGSAIGRLEIGGELDLAGASLVVKPSDALTGNAVHLVASYGTLTGNFGNVESLPSGYTLDYHYNGLNQIALVATVAKSDGE
jgi:autotransporter-associated beta strand protein